MVAAHRRAPPPFQGQRIRELPWRSPLRPEPPRLLALRDTLRVLQGFMVKGSCAQIALWPRSICIICNLSIVEAKVYTTVFGHMNPVTVQPYQSLQASEPYWHSYFTDVEYEGTHGAQTSVEHSIGSICGYSLVYSPTALTSTYQPQGGSWRKEQIQKGCLKTVSYLLNNRPHA